MDNGGLENHLCSHVLSKYGLLGNIWLHLLICTFRFLLCLHVVKGMLMLKSVKSVRHGAGVHYTPGQKSGKYKPASRDMRKQERVRDWGITGTNATVSVSF